MKKFILSALIVVFSVSASAQGDFIESDSDHSQQYQQTAMELLVAAKDSVSTTYVNGSNRDARPVINDAFSYIAEELFSVLGAFGGFDDEDEESRYQGDIDEAFFSCNLETAKCRLAIKYKSSSDLTRIDYKVTLKNNLPVAIENNRVTLSVSEQ